MRLLQHAWMLCASSLLSCNCNASPSCWGNRLMSQQRGTCRPTADEPSTHSVLKDRVLLRDIANTTVEPCGPQLQSQLGRQLLGASSTARAVAGFKNGDALAGMLERAGGRQASVTSTHDGYAMCCRSKRWRAGGNHPQRRG